MPTVAFRVTRRRRKFIHMPKVKKRLGSVLDDTVKPHFIEEFDRRVANWSSKNKPTFKARKFIRVDRIWLEIYPATKKFPYAWVTKGTDPYDIPKAGPSLLAFSAGYKPKTKPPGKFGGPGIATGPFIVRITQFTHPGIEAREFEKYIREDNKLWFSRTMENAWRRIIRSL